MVLDVSCMDTCDVTSPSTTVDKESTVDDREASLYDLKEYQEEIHDYLREAELRFRPKVFTDPENIPITWFSWIIMLLCSF